MNNAREIATQEALRELRILTTCHCSPPWTDRGLHETWCVAEYRGDVETLARALGVAE